MTHYTSIELKDSYSLSDLDEPDSNYPKYQREDKGLTLDLLKIMILKLGGGLPVYQNWLSDS